MLDVDVYSLIKFVLNSIAIVFGFLFLVNKTGSTCLAVGGLFDFHNRMSIGGDDGGRGDAVCAGCGRSGTKKCSRCKKVRYCSQACQSKHWQSEHKFKCKQMGCPDRFRCVLSVDSACRRRKYSGFDPVLLVPARGSSKVLQEPKKILFPCEEFIKLFNWDNPGFPPCGLINSGNSCFANVVLQCLACTRPLTAYLLDRDHCRSCIRKQENWCFLCELQAHVQRASQSRRPFLPINILSRIPNIGGNLGCESQEDAHEFMRFTIDTMQSVCLDEYGGEKALDPSTQETTLIQHIFGGHFLSQVTCTKCEVVSNRYENMMDLTVEIHGDAESLEECLEQFTARECLDGNDMYKCDGCNGYVKAWKRLTIQQAPNILTIALKRFQSGRFGKLNKRVTFPQELDLSPYMCEGGDGTDLYSLYAVVVHVDMLNASFFGHYICYTKDHYGQWYRIDDCLVTNVDVEEVLSQGAYMLLYSRVTPRKHSFVKPVEPLSKRQLTSGDIDSSNVPIRANVSNGLSNPPNIYSESNPSLLENTGHDRLAEIKSVTVGEYGDMELEVDPGLVHKDTEDVDMKDYGVSLMGPEESSTRHSHIPENDASDFQDIECEENVYTSNSHIEDNVVMPSDASITSSSSTGSESADASKLKPEKCLLSSGNGMTKMSPALQSGFSGKSKSLLSRGFLDKLGEEKFADHGRRNLTQKAEVGCTGATSGTTSERSNISTSDSSTAFVSRGFLSRSYMKSAAKQKIGRVGSAAACSGENSSTSSDVTPKTGQLGSEAACASENSTTSTGITPRIGKLCSEVCSSGNSATSSAISPKSSQRGSEAAFSSESSGMSIDFASFYVPPNGSPSRLDVDRASDGSFDGLPKQINGACPRSRTGE